MSELTPGATLADRYRLLRRLGQGGMGQIWAASHLITGRTVALKALKAERAVRPDLVRRFFREARAATVVSHPNVIQVHDVFLHEGSPIMVMDLLEGESLAERLDRGPTLSLSELCALMVPVISAVATAHARGIVHRDLKPENIFLVRDADNAAQPRVLDFGIAKLSGPEADADAAALTRTGSMLGTPFYMAPEQAAGERTFDHRCDIWALGVICYEALSGRRPFEGDNFGQVFKRVITKEPTSLAELYPTLPLQISELVAMMLRKEPAERATLSQASDIFANYTAVTAPKFGAPLSERRIGSNLDEGGSEASGIEAATLEEGADLVSEAERRAATHEAPSLHGTLDAATATVEHADRGLPRTRRGARRLLTLAALGALLLAAAASAVLGGRKARNGSTAPSATAVGASAAAISNDAPARSVLDAPRSLPVVAPAPSASVAPAPAAKRPLLRKPAAAVGAAPPKKLPGGILDQEHAPF